MCSGFFDPSLAAATLFVGIAIRFLDDYLDYQQDELLGRRTSWHYLQGAGIVYAMVALALGVRIAPSWGAALFFAAYGIGMATDPKAMLPSHLAGGMELVLASITAVIVGGWNLGLAALSYCWGWTFSMTAWILPRRAEWFLCAIGLASTAGGLLLSWRALPF